MPWTPSHAPTGFAECFAFIIEALCQATAARGAKDRSVPAALTILAWTRLRRLGTRFEALMAKVRAGRLPAAPATRRRAEPAPRLDRVPGVPRPLRLPRGFGWLLRLVPETVGYGGQVQHLLADPEMTALLAASPQARRILRPLCHMLAIKPPPSLRSPRRAEPASPAAPAASGPAATRGGRPPDAPYAPSRADAPSELNRADVLLALFLAGTDPHADPPPGLPAPA